MTAARELSKRRRAALAVCAFVPRAEVSDVLEMLGLLPLTLPRYRGSCWFDTGFDGGSGAQRKRTVLDHLEQTS